MSTLAETLADPSRPSFLFGGSIIFRALCLSLSLSLPASSSSSCYARFFLLRSARARASKSPFLLDRKASNPIGAHKTGAKRGKRRARANNANNAKEARC